MAEKTDKNRAELPLGVKLMNGYLEQVDLFGPAMVKAMENYKDTSVSAMGSLRNGVLNTVAKTNVKVPFVSTAADVLTAACTEALKLECQIVAASVKAYRATAVTVRDTLQGK